MNIRVAEFGDFNILSVHDKHISKEELERSIERGRIYIAEERGRFIGWLRYNLFWDNTPFMNMLYILDGYRGKGFGKALVAYWEDAMKSENYKYILTSTASDEYAQHFYVKLGYRTIGGFTLSNDPYEIILSKEI